VRRIGLTTLVLIASAAVGCARPTTDRSPAASNAAAHGHRSSVDPSPASLHAHPQAIEPVAGADAPATSAPATPTANPSVVPAGNARGTSERGAPAAGGAGAQAQVSAGSDAAGLAQPISEGQVRAELAASGMSASLNQASLTAGGLAIAPIDAPPIVQEVIAAGNQIAHLPYRYGGGHVTYEDTAYDCSGSISFVFEAAHLLDVPVVSGELMSWGAAGPGKWITVFANAGHTFMYVAGLRFDTVALAETGSRWSNRSADEPDLATFAVRHPAGL